MKKNRFLAIFLVVVVISTMLVACSSKKEYKDEDVTATEIVTDANGEAVTDENGETETVVVTVPNSNGNNSSSGNNSQSGNNGSSSESTTSPLATTEAPVPVAPEENPTKKSDIEMTIVMPFLSAYDQSQYKLILKIGKKELTYDVTGCRGQHVILSIPKGYDGDDAVIMLDMRGKQYNVDTKIQNGAKVVLQTIVVVDGDDD